jgi:two-component system cell cycle response regulator DivK
MTTLLVVEDDRSVSALMVELLRGEFGAAVLAVTDGDTALDVMRRRPDLSAVVIDLAMPRVDGLTVVRRMQEEPELRAIPVVAVSATVAGRADAALAAGCRAFVGKPFDLATLIEAVRSALR